MGQGFTIPVNVPGEPNGSCSFAVKSGQLLDEKTYRIAELVGIDAFHAARRVQGLPKIQALPHLSRRQLQCIALAGTGASDKVIARKLGLSPETPRLYLKTARAAYGAHSRADLVVRALRDGRISFLQTQSPD